MERVEYDGGLCIGLRGDFSGLGWVEAYDAATDALAAHYAYTTHRNIDWPSLSSKYRKRVVEATTREDKASYYLSWVDLISELRDGHCEVEPNSPEMQEIVAKLHAEQVGGGFGVVFGRTEAGVVVLAGVGVGVNSAVRGLAVGDVVLAINTVSIEEALQQASLRWCDPAPATTAHRDLERLRLLSRAPAGTVMELSLEGKAPHVFNVRNVRLVSEVSEQVSYSMQCLHQRGEHNSKEPYVAGVSFSAHDSTHAGREGRVGVIRITHFQNKGTLMEKALLTPTPTAL